MFEDDIDDIENADSDSDSDEDYSTPLLPVQEPRSLRTQRLSYLGTGSRTLSSFVQPSSPQSPSIAGSPNELARELRDQLNLREHSLFSSDDDDHSS